MISLQMIDDQGRDRDNLQVSQRFMEVIAQTVKMRSAEPNDDWRELIGPAVIGALLWQTKKITSHGLPTVLLIEMCQIVMALFELTVQGESFR
jgi:hypothetical protein